MDIETRINERIDSFRERNRFADYPKVIYINEKRYFELKDLLHKKVSVYKINSYLPEHNATPIIKYKGVFCIPHEWVKSWGVENWDNLGNK